jgi:hypothetical protein
VILLDSDVLLVDLRYRNDPRFLINQQALQRLKTENHVVGITVQALLETVGVLSFNVSSAHVAHLPRQLALQYGLTIFPDLSHVPDYAGCTVQEIVGQLGFQMALGDAVQVVQIAHYASFADCLLTWNAKHFQGKAPVAVLTPQDWLSQQSGSTP